jgi:glyoxylase-like metal-dependent hydrolase (beta-lactamase superfamily II)
MATQNIGRWRVGEAEIFSIPEVIALNDDIKVLLENATPDLLLKYPWLQPHYATPDGRMLINFQGFVVKAGGRIIVVDTCIGGDRQREYDVFCHLKSDFMDDLKSIGVTPDNVDIVLCTHLHFDHVGWNAQKVNDRWVPTFPNARYLFGRVEYEHWMMLYRTKGYHHLLHVEECIMPIIEAGLVDLIEMQHRISQEVWLEPTPGHTPGHVSVRISSLGQDAIITGDIMHSPIQIAVPDWQANFDMDRALGAQQRARLVKVAADQPLLVIGSHFPQPTAGHIVSDGSSWRFTGSS